MFDTSLISFIILIITVGYIIYYMNNNESTNIPIMNVTYNSISTEKIEDIPQEYFMNDHSVPKEITKYPDLDKFVHDIRNYFYLNKTDFYGVVNNITNFIKIYEDVMFNRLIYCTQNIEIAVGTARNAQNHFHSIINSLESDKLDIQKFNTMDNKLKIIMNGYIEKLHNRCDKTISDKIDNKDSYFTNDAPKPRNYYSNTPAQFDFY